MLLVILIHANLQIGTLATALVTLLIPGWWPITLGLCASFGLERYTKQRIGHYAPYSWGAVVFVAIVASALGAIRMRELLVEEPIWNIDVSAKPNLAIGCLAHPIDYVGISELVNLEIPENITDQQFEPFQFAADTLIARYITRENPTESDFWFFDFSLVRAKFPDNVTRDAWYRIVLTDRDKPDSSVSIVFVDAQSAKPLMLIRNAAIYKGETAEKLYDLCGSPFGVMPSITLFNHIRTILGGVVLCVIAIYFGYLILENPK